MDLGEDLPKVSEALELQFLLTNLTALDSIIETAKQRVSPECYGSFLSVYVYKLKQPVEPDENPSLLGEKQLTNLPLLPEYVSINWMDGPGVYANRKLHVGLSLLNETGMRADIYEVDADLPQGVEETTERYRNEYGNLPRYVVNWAGFNQNMYPESTLTIYGDGSVLSWQYNRESRNWSSLPL